MERGNGRKLGREVLAEEGQKICFQYNSHHQLENIQFRAKEFGVRNKVIDDDCCNSCFG